MMMASCLPCNAGMDTANQSGASVCSWCQAGFYKKNVTSDGHCQQCEPGRWSNSEGRTTNCDFCSSAHHCMGGVKCLAGRDSILCHKCTEQFYKTERGGECQQCPADQIFHHFLVAVIFCGVCFLLYKIVVIASNTTKSEQEDEETVDEVSAIKK